MQNNWDWVIPASVVNFNTLQEIKDLAKSEKLSNKIIQDLDLGRDMSQYSTEVTPFWLMAEAERLRTQIVPTMDGKRKKVVRKLADRMENIGKQNAQAANKWVQTTGKSIFPGFDVKAADYRQIPNSARYGQLRGIVVHRDIYEDIVGSMRMVTPDDSMLERVIGNGGKLSKFVNYWKWSKVAANPPAWARNMISNMILLNLSGVPLWRMPDLITSTLKDFSSRGKYYQIAKDNGIVSGNMSSAELGRIETEFSDLMRRMNKEGGKYPMQVYGAMKGALEKVQESTSNIYSGLETFGKMMAIKYAMETGLKEGGILSKKKKLTEEDAVQYANKWLFDYNLVNPSVRYARQSIAPFITFQSKAIPLMAEVALTRPWAFAPYYAMTYGMVGLFQHMFDIDDDEYERIKLGLPEWLREKSTPPSLFGIPILPANAIPFPMLDDKDEVQMQDVSYLFPWGMASEVASELGSGKPTDAIKSLGLLGGPTFSIITAITTGIDPFTRKEIVDPLGTPGEKLADTMKYIYNMAAPQPIHWDSGAFRRFAQGMTGEIDPKTGEAKVTPAQGVGRLFGQNIYSINLEESRRSNLRRLEYERANLLRKMNRELRGMRKQKKSQEEMKELRQDYLDRIKKLQKEYKEYQMMSRIPGQLRKAG